MDELGFNKLAAAVLATALGFMGIKEISHLAMHVDAPDIPAYALEIPEIPTGAEEEIELPFPSEAFVMAMDETRGERVFKKCQSCHNAEKGGANGTGPNLWNVVGAPAAKHAGFGYSNALATAGVEWTYASLDGFLTKPSNYVSGTNMNFIGLKKEEDRAAVIEYLRVHADAPVARPEPAPVPLELMEIDTVDDVVVEADVPTVIEQDVDADKEGAPAVGTETNQ